MKISFIASHGGSAAKYIIQAILEGRLKAEIGIVITNNCNSDIRNWCTNNNIDIHYISRKTHPIEGEEDAAIHRVLLGSGTDIIVLSGYMKKIGSLTLSEYSNKILNIHPSLLPAYGGKGMYGDRVHKAVIESKDNLSGATVQFINEEYDEGPIITQKTINISSDETVESLKSKVQAIEGELYLSAIKLIAHKAQ